MPALKLRYLSILKPKTGEIEAVKRLASHVWDKWNPLFELDADLQEKDDGILSALVTGLVDDIVHSCRKGATVFLDLDDISLPDNGGASRALDLLNRFAAAELVPIPVMQLSSSSNVQAAVKEFISGRSGVCAIRIDLSELKSDLSARVGALIATVSAQIQESFLIIDLGAITSGFVDQLSVVLPQLIRVVPSLDQWRSVTLVGTGVPHILGIPSGSDSILPRSEWELFTRIRAAMTPMVRRLDFGDFAISHPDPVDFDPKTMQMSPKIYYTINDGWIVYKGRGVRRFTWAQTHAMCAALASRPEFLGMDYSYGDHYILACAEKHVAQGNATIWKRVGTNHHITFVANQVANLGGA